MYTIYKKDLLPSEDLLEIIFSINHTTAIKKLREIRDNLVSLTKDVILDSEDWALHERPEGTPIEINITYDNYIAYASGLLALCEALEDPLYKAEFEAAGDNLAENVKITQKEKEVFARSAVSSVKSAAKLLSARVSILRSGKDVFR